MTSRLLSLAVLALVLVVGCGGSGGADSDASGINEDSGPVVKTELPLVQEMASYSEADFLSKVEADSDLQEIWSALQAEGYTKFQYAGLTRQGDDTTVLWGEVAGATTGLLRHCQGDDCLGVRWTLAGNTVTWQDSAGQEVTPRGVGLPVLLKQLEGHSYDMPTHVVDLALDDPPDQLPVIDVSKRRFYLLNAFGSLWGEGHLDVGALESAAKDSQAFDSVVRHDYVRADVVDDLLLHSHPYDVLVWFGQTVREEAKTNEIWKPIGMTTNVGLFGDTLYDQKRLSDRVESNPLNGPGLMVLAGCETMGDGNGGGAQDKSIPVTLDNQTRVVVGFKQCGDARDVLEATRQFLSSYLSGSQGASLGTALDKANAYLASQDSDLAMTTFEGADLTLRFLPDVDDFWSLYTDDGEPGDSIFNSYIHIVNKCTAPDGTTYQEDEDFASAWSKETKWTGPFFTGSRTNPENQVDFSFSGALVEIAEEAHFFFVVNGSLSPRVKDLTLYGTGVIDKIVLDKEKLDEFILEFKGTGKASPYVNEAGDTCEMQDPLLVSSTGEPGTFKIPVTWRQDEAQ
jgi:hypothetical protein